ncbi:hypothetical protein KR222_009377, partial [Zaprionus bogoriensis]
SKFIGNIRYIDIPYTQPLAPRRTQVLRIHQVSREEYNELLKLTNGQPVVDQARLLSSPLNGIKHLASKTGISAGIASIPGFFDFDKKHRNPQSYPLCVISTDDKDDKDEKRLSGYVAEDEEGGEEEEEGDGHTGSDTPTTFCTLVVQGAGDGNVIYPNKPKPKPKPDNSNHGSSGHHGNQGHHSHHGNQGHHSHHGNQGHESHHGHQGHHGSKPSDNNGHHEPKPLYPAVPIYPPPPPPPPYAYNPWAWYWLYGIPPPPPGPLPPFYGAG